MATEQLTPKKAFEIGVLKGHFPRYVYKYRPWNEFTKDIFINSQLWFPNPQTFNDPFDCQIVSNTENSVNEIKTFLEKDSSGMSSKQRKALAKSWRNKPYEWHKLVNTTINSTINNSGVCCFAGSNDNILMWSHYTNSHKGICIKFDLLADLNFFLLPLKIKYKKDYPIYNHLKDSTKIIECLFQTKSECWSYENELRVIKPEKGNCNYKFDKRALVEICFGCNITHENIQEVKNLLTESNFNHVKVTKAKTSISTYQLVISDLK